MAVMAAAARWGLFPLSGQVWRAGKLKEEGALPPPPRWAVLGKPTSLPPQQGKASNMPKWPNHNSDSDSNHNLPHQVRPWVQGRGWMGWSVQGRGAPPFPPVYGQHLYWPLLAIAPPLPPFTMTTTMGIRTTLTLSKSELKYNTGACAESRKPGTQGGSRGRLHSPWPGPVTQAQQMTYTSLTGPSYKPN